MGILNNIKSISTNAKYSRLLRKIYQEEDLLPHLSELFGATFRIDWIGRVYAVLNPNIRDGKWDPESQVFEMTDDGLNNDAYVEKWIMDRLNVAKGFIRVNNLFDLLSYEIRPLDDYGNYLFIFKPITLDDAVGSVKKILAWTGGLIVGGTILAVVLNVVLNH